MLPEQEDLLHLEPLFLNQKQRSILKEDVLKTAFRFPKLFKRSLYRTFEQMVVNAPADFLSNRTIAHLRMILGVQFFLQEKMEAQLRLDHQKQLFIKMFRNPGRICVALVWSSSYTFQKEQLLKALDSLLPGISEVSRSFYLCHSSEHPYYFSYFEVHKLRGKEIPAKQLRSIEKALKEQMLASSPLTPAVFWPYNKEESHRQIQLLLREMKTETDLPHISIHFQKQTASSLEFLIHLVQPQTKIPLALDKLPESLHPFRYSQQQLHTPFPIAIEVFSIKMNSHLFEAQNTINLLYARRYLIKHLEVMIGQFRDFNGGLLEKQQDHFETIRLHLASKIPSFDLFAEKLFYALHPFEKWYFFPLSEVEELFLAFSKLIQDQKLHPPITTPSGLFTVVKSENKVDFLRYNPKKSAPKELSAYAQISIGNFQYECFSGPITKQLGDLLKKPKQEKPPLRLIFQEGAPLSLNPHYSAGDMRCRLISKMLFEGLFRLDSEGNPELAGAIHSELSTDGLTYLFHLRKCHWSNGEKVTAFDYTDSWKWALQDLVSHPELLFSIKNACKFREKKCSLEQVGIKALDAETIQVKLEEPDPDFFYKLTQPFFFPQFHVQGEPKWFNGPYLVREMVDHGIRLTKNPYYWKTELGSFEDIEIDWIDNIAQIYQHFKEGKIDWIGDPLTILSLEQIQELEGKQLLQKKEVKRRFSLHFNTKHPLLNSPLIRKALSYSIDRMAICKEIFPHSIPLGSLQKKEAIDFFEKGLAELGLTKSTFPPLTFTYSDQTRRDQLAAYLKKTWKKVLGIEVHLEQLPWNSFRSRLENREFEICGTLQDTLNEDSLNYLERFEGASSWNFAQWESPIYRKLIAATKKERDSAKQKQLMQQAKTLLSEQIPFASLFDYVHLYAHQPKMKCSHFDLEGCIDFSKGRTLIK